jgi:hypothetical protein
MGQRKARHDHKLRRDRAVLSEDRHRVGTLRFAHPAGYVLVSRRLLARTRFL